MVQPVDWERLLRDARRFEVAGRRPEAALLYSGLLSGPKRVNALQSLGKISFENGDLQAAQHFLGAALELAPDHLESLHLRGVALMRLGDTGAPFTAWNEPSPWPPDSERRFSTTPPFCWS